MALQAMSSIDPNRLSPQLTSLVLKCYDESSDAQTQDKFYQTLDKVLALSPIQEMEVIAQAVDALQFRGHGDAVPWLIHELEVEAQLQYVRKPGQKSGRDKACVLFALPVMAPLGADIAAAMVKPWEPDAIMAIHEVLEDADIVDNSASFGLVPHLYSHQELSALSYGQMARLTRELGAQVLEGNSVLKADFEGSLPAPWDEYTQVCLGYILGAVVTEPEDLEDVFPALSDEGSELEEELNESDDEMDVGSNFGFRMAGVTSDERRWEEGFFEAFDEAFLPIEGVVGVLPPDGLIEDLRRGASMARELSLVESIQTCIEQALTEGQEKAQELLSVSISQVKKEGQDEFIEVSFRRDARTIYRHPFKWYVLDHESIQECVQALHSALSDYEKWLEPYTLEACASVGGGYLH